MRRCNAWCMAIAMPLLLLLVLAVLTSAVKVEEHNTKDTVVVATVRGVQDAYRAHFDRAAQHGLFGCLDGSATVTFARINDEVCDCADCSDEPGTAACTTLRPDGTLPSVPTSPPWRFQCTTPKVKNHTIFHSRVNDGFCDCCDGSDEYDGLVRCPDTCDTLAQEQQRAETAALQARETALANKAAMRAEALAQHTTAVRELPGLERTMQNVTAELAVAEPELRTRSERESAAYARREALREAWYNHTEDTLLGPESTRGGCLMWRQTSGCDEFGPREPEGDRECREVVENGNAGYCECAANTTTTGNNTTGAEAEVIKHSFPCEHKTLQCSYVCAHDGEDGLPDYLWPETGRTTPPSLRSEETIELEKRVAELRKVRDETSALLEKYRRVVSLGINNTEVLLRTLEGQTFNVTDTKYRYDVSLFQWVRQCVGTNTFGTSIGKWGHFAASSNSLWSKDALDYSLMNYDDGAYCTSEVNRHAEVRLVCGEANKLVSVSEPTACTYKMIMETPVLCDD